MKTCCICYWNNNVGVKTDAFLIKECLSQFYKCDIYDFSTKKEFFKKNNYIGIFVQDWDLKLLENNKINICIPNEEWLTHKELLELKNFDYVICKSKHAANLLKPYCNTIQLYFWSKDMSDNRVIGLDTKLHFAGKSIQKNTEILLDLEDLTIIDSTQRFKNKVKGNYIDYFLSEEDIKFHLNINNLHICTSLYEAHGHYMFEGMSCNKTIIATDLPVWTEQIDPQEIHFVKSFKESYKNLLYEFSLNNNYPLREMFLVDPFIFYKPENWEHWLRNKKNPRHYILSVFEKNKREFVNFLNQL